MNARLELDTRQFMAGLRKVGELGRTKSAQIVNQAALDVAGYCWDNTPPGSGTGEFAAHPLLGTGKFSSAQQKRAEIKKLLNTQLSTAVKLAKSGKRKGIFIRRKGRNNELRSKHLIANWWRGKAGKPGLYGKAMLRYAGKMTGKRQLGVGALMAPFLPIIRGLNRVAKYKFPFSKTSGAKVAVWPGSAGSGVVTAKPGANPTAMLMVKTGVRNGQEGRVGKILTAVLQAALNWKAGKLLRQAERELAKEFTKV